MNRYKNLFCSNSSSRLLTVNIHDSHDSLFVSVYTKVSQCHLSGFLTDISMQPLNYRAAQFCGDPNIKVSQVFGPFSHSIQTLKQLLTYLQCKGKGELNQKCILKWVMCTRLAVCLCFKLTYRFLKSKYVKYQGFGHDTVSFKWLCRVLAESL